MARRDVYRIPGSEMASLRETARGLGFDGPRLRAKNTPARPKAPRSDPALAGDVAAFVRHAQRDGFASGDSLDRLFARLGQAHERGEHADVVAGAIPLLDLLEDGLDLGQNELYEEVLSDLPALSARVLYSTYAATPGPARPAALSDMLGRLESLYVDLDQPLSAMQAIGPLGDLGSFLPRWTDHLAQLAERDNWSRSLETLAAQRREAARLGGGSEGLRALAEASRQSDDLFEWVMAVAAEEELAEVARAAKRAANLAKGPADEARFLVLLARAEAGRGRSPTAALRDALTRAPDDLTFRRWLASVPRPKRSALLTAIPPGRDRSLSIMLAALQGRWADVAKAVPNDLSSAHSPFGGDARAAVHAIAWCLAEDPTSILAPLDHGMLVDDPAAWLDEDIASLDGLPPLPTPTFLALLSETRPRRPNEPEAMLLLEALGRAALSTIEVAAARGKSRHYADAAAPLSVAVALTAERDCVDAAIDLFSRGLAAAKRKPALRKQIERAIAGDRRQRRDVENGR